MIINIRGTHGSGKSTAVRDLMQQYITAPIKAAPTDKRPIAYQLTGALDQVPVFIIGPYETACGGCDAIQPYDRIWPLVEKYAKKGHVVFEGALVSSSVGEIGRSMAARRKKDCVVCFLDTPVEVCLKRIEKRRKKKGDDRPLNPHNTTVKHQAVERSRPKLEALGLRCETINHKKDAATQLLEIMYPSGGSK